jgi:S1/P1 Nuclease
MRKVLFTLLVVCIALPAFGWGPDGHRIVCRIAFNELSRDQQREVDRLARLYRKHGAEFTSFAQSCVFADTLRDVQEFQGFDVKHFFNLRRTDRNVSMCPGECVLKAINQDADKLRTASRDVDRAEALFFLGHWYGDIHQPLHISFQDDRGGNSINSIRGNFFASNNNNLHKVWDSGIIQKMMGESWQMFADFLSSNITDEEREEWRGATPEQMAQESFDIATLREVLYCRMDGSECEAIGNTRTLERAYLTEFDSVVQRRLQKAGVRLAESIKANLGD